MDDLANQLTQITHVHQLDRVTASFRSLAVSLCHECSLILFPSSISACHHLPSFFDQHNDCCVTRLVPHADSVDGMFLRTGLRHVTSPFYNPTSRSSGLLEHGEPAMSAKLFLVTYLFINMDVTPTPRRAKYATMPTRLRVLPVKGL